MQSYLPFSNRLPLLVLCGLALFCAVPARADYKADIGYTQLQAELGSAIVTGSGVNITQTEATDTNGNYEPDLNSSEFIGKSFVIKSATSGISNHATTVGTYYYGNASSVAPGISTIDVYNANGWISTGFLNIGTNAAPKTESRSIENHSWIGTLDNGGSSDVDALRRFDFAIGRDNFLAIVGINNGSASAIPSLLANSYNSISVGLTSGDHSSGTTTVDGSGRVKPEIVALTVDNLTSFATPTVGSAGALLIQKARGTAALLSATNTVVLKALLLAGATKSQFPTWNRTTTRPLDSHYGAGQLNIYNSYHILVAGKQAASTSVTVRPRGWDFAATTSGSKLYFFDIAASNNSPSFSALLTWHRIIADTVSGPLWGSPSSTLPDLTLKLYSATGFTVGTLVDSSVSTVDNIEHIYQPSLAPGRYALEVTSNQTGVNYGLAWNSVPTVNITASTPNASEQGAVSGSFAVTRSGDTTDALIVNYTVGGTATNGSDYSLLSQSVTIPAGATSATITVTPIPDSIAEGDETVMLTLSNDLSYSVGSSGTATVTIHDLPFDAWRFSQFAADLNDSAVSGVTADHEGDGIPNLVEYALNLDPNVASIAELPVVGINNGALTLSYTHLKSATDITYLVEVTTDLVTWHSGSGYTSVLQVTDHGATETIQTGSLIPLTTSPQVMRLKVTRP